MQMKFILNLVLCFLLLSCAQIQKQAKNTKAKKQQAHQQEIKENKISLQEKLNNFAAVAKSKLSQEQKKVMIEALYRLKNQGLQNNFPKIGDSVRNFKLKDSLGSEVNLYDTLNDNAVLLLFYRGSWDPYCNLELKEYKDYYQEFLQANVQIFAISPEKKSLAQAFQNYHVFPFPLLIDKKNKLAKRFNLVYELDAKLVPIYENMGIDLKDRNDNKNNELTVPAAILIDQNRVIKYVFAELDYKKRAEPDSVLAVVKARL
jgi:peroxiredoxin